MSRRSRGDHGRRRRPSARHAAPCFPNRLPSWARAASAMRRATSGGRAGQRTAPARRSGRRGGTRSPVSPGITTSDTAFTAVATTGIPHAMASTHRRGQAFVTARQREYVECRENLRYVRPLAGQHHEDGRMPACQAPDPGGQFASAHPDTDHAGPGEQAHVRPGSPRAPSGRLACLPRRLPCVGRKAEGAPRLLPRLRRLGAGHRSGLGVDGPPLWSVPGLARSGAAGRPRRPPPVPTHNATSVARPSFVRWRCRHCGGRETETRGTGSHGRYGRSAAPRRELAAIRPSAPRFWRCGCAHVELPPGEQDVQRMRARRSLRGSMGHPQRRLHDHLEACRGRLIEQMVPLPVMIVTLKVSGIEHLRAPQREQARSALQPGDEGGHPQRPHAHRRAQPAKAVASSRAQ